MFEKRLRAYRAMGYQVDEMGDDGEEKDGDE
jgi:hypothetical protein